MHLSHDMHTQALLKCTYTRSTRHTHAAIAAAAAAGPAAAAPEAAAAN